MQASLASRPSEEELQDLQQRLRTAETLLDAQMAAEGRDRDPQAGVGDLPGEGSDPTQSLVSILQVRCHLPSYPLPSLVLNLFGLGSAC